MILRGKPLIIIVIFILTSLGISFGASGFNSSQSFNDKSNELKTYEPLYLDSKNRENNYITSANQLLHKNLVVSEDINENVSYEIEQIDWDMNATSSPNTFSLYLHTLRPVYYLTKAYIQTGDKKYISAAEKFVFSWKKYDEQTENKNRYAWYDHSVAERTENLIYFSIVYKSINSKNNNLVMDMINKNTEWLMNDKNYTKKHNHGIFEDGTLIKAGYYLKQENYVSKGIERINEQFKYAFPNKHIHVENSIGYHFGLISYIKNLKELLSAFNNEYSAKVSEIYNGAIDYLVYVYKPNLTLPLLGDTIGYKNNVGVIPDNFDNEYLKFVQNKGKSGDKPEKLSRIYQDDGYAIFREHWDSNNFEQSTWLLFKSGYSSSTHKHADDLSFLLYSKGHDIFVDPGMYNYMVGNEMHDYTNNNLSHNTVNVDDKSYSISMFNSEKVGLYGYKKEKGYEVVTGINNIFNGVNIDRSISYINGNQFLIVDDITSKEEHKYSQLFHLSNDVELITLSRDNAILRIIGTDYYVLMQQLNGSDDVKKYSGSEDPRNLSYISKGLNQMEETATMSFQKSGSSTRFVTSIKIVSQEELPYYKEHRPEYNGNLVRFNDVVVNVPTRERLPEMNVEVQINGNQATLINKSQSLSEGLAYSFYLMNKETGMKYASSSYSNDNHALFTLEKGKSYAIISYMRNRAKETSKKLIGYIEESDGKFLFTKIPPEKQEPAFIDKSVNQISDHTYEFSVKISNMNQISAKWYIYRNGASYDFIANQSDHLQYTFKEPGVYTCIYRINDVYFGEVEYNNFKEIVIK